MVIIPPEWSKIQSKMNFKAPIMTNVGIALAILIFGLIATFSVSRTRNTHQSTPVPTPQISKTPLPDDDPLHSSISQVYGDADKGGFTFQSDKLGIVFTTPTLLGIKQLTEKIDIRPDNTQFENIALSYCLVNDYHEYPYYTQGCTEGGFIISSFTKGVGLGADITFIGLTGFVETISGAKVKWSFSGVPLSDKIISNTKIIKNINNIQILKTYGETKYSELLRHNVGMLGHPAEGYIGAIVNLPDNPSYSGFTIQMKLSDTLTEKVFDQILDSIKIVK